jgi:cell wall-associated NlpC family hydrolase
MRPLPPRIILVAAVLVGLLVPARAAFAFSDVSKSYWAYDAITYVASTNTWMQDFGTDLFQPTAKEARKLMARTLVMVYAPTEPIDPTITFTDLPDTDPFYPYANVAVKLGWMLKLSGDTFGPNKNVQSAGLDRSLIRAMGLWDAIDGLANIHQADGTPYTTEDTFPERQLARWLGLHYDHDDENLDMLESSYITRDEMAYSLWIATTLSQYELDSTSIFNDITLADATVTQGEFTQYMLNEVGYPYIWGGEWNKKSPNGYCCGSQPKGGMDCSGWVWWTLKKNEENYNAAQYHPDYGGWHISERVSSDMAAVTVTHLTYSELVPGNLMFFASNGGNNADDVDHVGIYLGNNWMIHSTGGGPQLEWVGSGWYYDNFVWGRKLKQTGNGAPRLPVSARAGEFPVRP